MSLIYLLTEYNAANHRSMGLLVSITLQAL